MLEGHFELRSGLHSDRYFQCAAVLSYPREAARLCAGLVEKLREEGVSQVDSVLSPAMGGIVVGHEVARALDCRSMFVEKVNDKLEMRRFALRKGERVLVAEDVITRGGRVQETIDIVHASGAHVAAVAVLVDRSGGKACFDCPTFSLLQMEPVVWEPRGCPLCIKGIPMTHPGS